MKPPSDVAHRLATLPTGTINGTAHGRRYSASLSTFNGGRSLKFEARELGGGDYISFNYYDLKNGARIFPCEMPAEKVIAFLRSFEPERSL